MNKLISFVIASLMLAFPQLTHDTSRVDTSGIPYAESYADVYRAIEKAGVSYFGYMDDAVAFAEEEMAMPSSAPTETPSSAANEADRGTGSNDYSTTNVQVEGIDEGDIVKTDGTYIYILSSGKLYVVRADGAATSLISSVKVTDEENVRAMPYSASDIVPGTGYSSEYATEMYIAGSYIAIITQYYDGWETERDGARVYRNRDINKVYVYDVSDPASPKLVHELGQDGYALSSRLNGNTLYLLSTCYIYDIMEDAPETFIPALYRDGKAELVSEGCIAIMPEIQTASYTVISAIDVPAGKVTANQTLLGGGNNVYMSHDNLYLASTVYETTEGKPYTDGIYRVVDYLCGSATNITRLDISVGGVEVAAYGSLPGYLESQFSMDEHKGHLRVVTTDDTYKYSIYTDEAKGFTNYWHGENSVQTNGLYVMDMSLTTVGSVNNLAPGEQVYSARFAGDIGYFVTFRTVDPLFAADLSDPANPTILSALKIPGFSEYLHVYSDGLLFGLGMNADQETGRTNGMKLSMFDTSNPADVSEIHKLSVGEDYSSALYNHKAILIDPGKNIIGFPAGGKYLVYGYDSASGFYRRASIEISEGWYNNSRGLYISGCFYIVSDKSVTILDMISLKPLGSVLYA